jgi:predicted O-methyltransferase YrrM
LNHGFVGRLFTCEVLMNVPSTLLSALHTSVRVVDNRLNRLELRRKKRGLGLREERDRSLEFVSRVFDCDARAFLQELESSTFRVEYRRRLGQLDSEIRGHSDGTSSEFDCETLYVTVRAARPSVVVETGVLFGAFSAHILEALSRSGGGTLVSFDMPERHGRNELKDYLVPDSLRSARRLVLGDTRRTLESELQGLPRVDLFNHDSWHVFSHMMWEFLIADKYLSPGGVLCSHDVLETPQRPNAFPLFADARDYTYGVFRNFGVARKPGMRVSLEP